MHELGLDCPRDASILTFDDDGMIADFKVMVRPLKAVNKVWEMMAAQLEQAKD